MRSFSKPRYTLIFFTVVGFAGCGGGGGDEVCDPAANSGCESGLVCEPVAGGGDPVCVKPLVVRGRVFDLADDSPIEGARVVALDVNGAPVSSVAVTATDGSYTLGVPVTRDADGNPVDIEFTLRADADGYQTFPSGLRQALPIDTANRTDEEDAFVVETPNTDIGLFALAAGAGSGQIHGTVEVPPSRAGILVVAETSSGTGSARGFSAIADRDGAYRLFNLPAGNYTVTAYAVGSSYTPGAADIVNPTDDIEVDLSLSGEATGTVTGTVQIVNAPGGSVTSVILVVTSTFNDALKRGDTPPGMRVGDVTGTYTFEGVPAGAYTVLGAFENDGLVRDPDVSIGGTAIQEITVTAGGTTTVEGFKITGALAVLSPGAEGVEVVTDATPTFRWEDDSSEDEYLVELFDTFGNRIWFTDPPLPGVSGDTPEVTYPADAPALEAGMYYQFRVTSIKDGVHISTTEDLRGVFLFQP